MHARERERLARRAIVGDRTAALKWHAMTPDRATDSVPLSATRFPGTPSPYGPLDVDVNVEVDDEQNVYVSAHASLEHGSFSCAWILFEDSRTIGRSFADIHPVPRSERERAVARATELQLSLEPKVAAWINENAVGIGRCFVRTAAQRVEWKIRQIEQLRDQIARTEELLADRVIDELKARRDVAKPWRSVR